MAHTQEQRTALVVAHPGHELRIYHWLELTRPVTFILTDGSGHTDCSRLHSSTTTLARTGATRGAIYGAMSDRQLYEAILGGERKLFEALVDELAAALQCQGATCVVGDAAEGFNPGHDVCRLLLNAAVARIERTAGHRLKNMEFALEGPPQHCPPPDRAEAVILALDEGAFARKIAAVAAYPELAAEVDRVLGTHTAEAFRTECILPVRYDFDLTDRSEHPCVYERYGEQQVAAGLYREVIRFRDHIAPLAAHLGSMVGALEAVAGLESSLS
jgi:hypothetical protein